MSDCPKNHHFENFSQDCALEDIPIQGMLITYTFTLYWHSLCEHDLTNLKSNSDTILQMCHYRQFYNIILKFHPVTLQVLYGMSCSCLLIIFPNRLNPKTRSVKKNLGLIWIQNVKHSEGFPEIFFEKVNFEKKMLLHVSAA